MPDLREGRTGDSERRAAIDTIAEELCGGTDVVEGARIVELVRTCPLAPIETEASHLDVDAESLPREVSYPPGSSSPSCCIRNADIHVVNTHGVVGALSH